MNTTKVHCIMANSHTRRTLPGTVPCPTNGYSSHLGTGIYPRFVCSVNILHHITVAIDQSQESPEPVPVSCMWTSHHTAVSTCKPALSQIWLNKWKCTLVRSGSLFLLLLLGPMASRLQPGLHVTHACAFSFDLCRHVLENANVKCKHDHLLP